MQSFGLRMARHISGRIRSEAVTDVLQDFRPLLIRWLDYRQISLGVSPVTAKCRAKPKQSGTILGRRRVAGFIHNYRRCAAYTEPLQSASFLRLTIFRGVNKFLKGIMGGRRKGQLCYKSRQKRFYPLPRRDGSAELMALMVASSAWAAITMPKALPVPAGPEQKVGRSFLLLGYAAAGRF